MTITTAPATPAFSPTRAAVTSKDGGTTLHLEFAGQTPPNADVQQIGRTVVADILRELVGTGPESKALYRGGPPADRRTALDLARLLVGEAIEKSTARLQAREQLLLERLAAEIAPQLQDLTGLLAADAWLCSNPRIDVADLLPKPATR